MIDQELTWQQKVFCKHYLSNDFNGTKAAIAAGYSEKCARNAASRLLTYTHIQAYLSKLMNETTEKLGITFEWKLQLLKDTAIASYEGRATKEGFVNASGVVSCLSEMNKMQGHYAKTDNSNDEQVSDDVKETVNEFEKEY